jgi:hypothetical protein
MTTATDLRGAEKSYSAFISYRRDGDEQLAKSLQSGLQRLAKPWFRARALRVFRDETNLSADPKLWHSIERALERSDYFILLARRRRPSRPGSDAR